ncbi:DeoR/GlpR family DNA-binding transcription regulator [Megamonas sp.]|uniref:DeoR/GlpR family DNA-binding transcription regulator n=1 Tax=Megamonas sp. TaxID=2049033 RepID=UPI002590D29A|nr:DeoR/GlpR family DNA-binding transcription regulator [Megamonas sp.]
MFVEERHALIIQELKENGRVKVKELSAKFKVSEDLIRKDLALLAQQGKLKKTYGGAVLIKENVHREFATQRKSINLVAKQKIAQKALSLIKDDYVVFLDISTINIELAYLIAKSDLKAIIVTNMLEIVNILAKSNIRVIFIGGEFDFGKDGFVGSLTIEMLKNFRFDLAFMGVVSVDIHDNAVTTYMANDGITKKEVLNISRKSYMMAESEKLKQSGSYKYANIEDFQGIITDENLTETEEKELLKYNIEIINR